VLVILIGKILHLAPVLKAIMRPTLMTGIVSFVTQNVNHVENKIKTVSFVLKILKEKFLLLVIVWRDILR
jgi:hypothetical protein